MLATVGGFRPPTSLSTITSTLPVWQRRGHFHLHAPNNSLAHIPRQFLVAPHFVRAVSVNYRRSAIRSHGIRCAGCGVSAWGTSAAGRSGASTGVLFSGYGELVPGSGRGRVRVVSRVWKNSVSVAMDWPSVPLLDQYLMREMVPVLVLAVGICATLGMSLGALAGLIREVAVSGLPLRVAGAAALLQLPYFAAVSMPTACLAASLFGLGRLQSDMESVALFAAGVPLWRMLLTPVCLCLVAALLKLASHNYLVPYGSSQAQKIVEAALTTHLQGLRQSEDLIYQEYGTTEEMGEDGRRIPSYGLQRIWYASQIEGACLAGLLLLDVSPSGYVHRVVVGDAAEWQTDGSTWKFSNSTVLDVSPEGNTRRLLQMDGLRVPSTPLTSGRAYRKRTLHEGSRGDIVREIKRLGSRRSPDGDGMSDRVIDMKLLNKLECFLCQRDAAAFSCVVYGLIGAIATLAPSGRGSRAVSRATPFAWAISASLVYSATVAVAVALGSAGALRPWLSAWLPPLLGCSILLLVMHILVSSELQQQLLKLAVRAKKLRTNPTSS